MSQTKRGPWNNLDLRAHAVEVSKKNKNARGGRAPRTLGAPGLCPPSLFGLEAIDQRVQLEYQQFCSRGFCFLDLAKTLEKHISRSLGSYVIQHISVFDYIF